MGTTTPTTPAPAAPVPEPAAPSAAARRRRRRASLATLGLVSPTLGWLLLFFLVPLAFIIAFSVGLLSFFPGEEAFTLDAWRNLVSNELYLSLFLKSIRMSLTISVLAVLMAYPVAYFLAFVAGRRRYVLLLVVLAPFLASFLLRVLAWKVILGDQGALNSLVWWLGFREAGDPLPSLLFSEFTVIITLVYIWMPWVALPIFVALEDMDRSLLEAASDLGASRFQAFLRVTLPLSLPGVFAGFLFVFIPTIGEFVVPLLVGGTRGIMFGNLIADMFGASFDWRMGSVLALFLLAVVALFARLSSRFLQLGNAGVR